MRRVTYEIPSRGLATDFTEVELPLAYAKTFRNRFINRLGGAEKRRGIQAFGNDLAAGSTVTGMHELIGPTGDATLFASSLGVISRFDDPSWTTVYTMPSADRLRTVQMRDKLIFFNGVDRAVFTEDGTTFKELKALMEVGLAGSDTSSNRLDNADITDWSTGTDVAVNDVVFYPTLSAYAVVTLVSASAISHTAVSAGATGVGQGSGAPTTSTPFEVIDMVPLNVIDNTVELDNTAVGTSGTSTTKVSVSGVDFTATEARAGDFIRNTTRSALTQVTAVSASSLTVKTVAGQSSGDSFVFLKSAMPIIYHAHVHYERAYYADARDRRRLIVSAPYDPQDVSTGGGTLDDITFFTGALQPRGDVIVSLGSYQRFFVIGGEHNVFIYEGTTPVGSAADFNPIALFPQGVIAQDGILNIGNDLVFISHDGLQSTSQIADSSQLGRDTLTFAIADTLRNELDNVASRDEIIVSHYRQRSWVLLKVGDTLYVYNYATRTDEEGPQQGTANVVQVARYGSLSLFDGLIAQSACFLERRNDKLLMGGTTGKVYLFDEPDQYTDDGTIYTTEIETGWLRLDNPKKHGSPEIKAVKYIEPTFQSNANISYQIDGTGGFEFDSSDTINIAASSESSQVGTATIPFKIGGSPVSSKKHAIRIRGQAVQLRFSTSDALGPDTIGHYTLYAAIHGAA